jgi:hypothetical protein
MPQTDEGPVGMRGLLVRENAPLKRSSLNSYRPTVELWQ